MKTIFRFIIKYTRMVIVGIWDFIFFFFGFPYEKQASKLDLKKVDPVFRGPPNQKTTHKIYRPTRGNPRVYEESDLVVK